MKMSRTKVNMRLVYSDSSKGNKKTGAENKESKLKNSNSAGKWTPPKKECWRTWRKTKPNSGP